MSAFERHRGPERRRQSRGGRRVSDKRGLAPLVLVADEDAHSLEMCEAILAKLNFAVAPVDSIEKAASVVETLRPDVVVAHGHDVSALQRAAWPSGVAFVTVTDEMRDPEALVEAIRRAIRETTTLRRV
jgi:hypothetical protein